MDKLVFERSRKQTGVELAPAFMSNSGDLLREMAIAGVGVVAAPSFLMQAAVDGGQLEELLREWTLLPRPKLWALYPHRRFVPAKVRLFVDALRIAFSGDQWSAA